MKKIVVIGVIALFVCVGVQPAFAVDIPEKEEIEPKDYLFQTSIDITNNPDVKDIHPLLKRYQVIQKELTSIIKDKDGLNRLTEQLSDLPCDCENDNTTGWNYPVFCLFLVYLWVFAWVLYWKGFIGSELMFIIGDIAEALNCFWLPPLNK